MTEIILTDKLTVELVKHNADDETVLHAARVSTTGERGESSGWAERDSGLIRYLMNNEHMSPFEHNSITLFVHAPIFVFREWMRHRTLSYNEESARYRQLQPLFYMPNAARPLIQVGKVGQYTFEPGPEQMYLSVVHNLSQVYQVAYNAYERMIEEGVCKEVARNALPVSVYSSMYVTGNIRNWFNFLELRNQEWAQHEIRDCANQVEQILSLTSPRTLLAWKDKT